MIRPSFTLFATHAQRTWHPKTATVAAAIAACAAVVAAGCGQESTLKITRATYGANCRAPQGNDTARLSAACDGKSTCEYVVDFKKIGDPAPGCPKDYAVVYTCSGAPPAERTATLEAEAGLQKTVRLSCN
jgi:hypothetical protein